MDALALGSSFPAIRTTRDLHPLANAHVEPTNKNRVCLRTHPIFIRMQRLALILLLPQ